MGVLGGISVSQTHLLFWSGKGLPLYHTIQIHEDPRKKAFENIVGKGENTGDQYLLLFTQYFLLNSLSKDKIFYWSKLKAFAEDRINVNVKFQFIPGRVENIVGKGENAG